MGNVREAAQRGAEGSGREIYVGLDIGPTGKLLKPMGDLAFEDAYEAFAEVMEYGEKAGADLIHIETMSDTYEVKAAVLAAKERTSLPVFATMIFDERGKLFDWGRRCFGWCDARRACICKLPRNQLWYGTDGLDFEEELLTYTSLPVIVKPNAGLPKQRDGQTYYDVVPEEFASTMKFEL